MARELTKLHESVLRGNLGVLSRSPALGGIKGEVVIVVDAPGTPEVADEVITERLEAALQTLRLKDAAVAVAGALGVPRARVYDLGLQLKGERER